MATTTNYSWTTPDDTDLVKDGAAAIRTLGSAVDTTTKNLNPETTLGDIAYRSSTANVKTRLALGTAGQVLTVNSGATAPEWATAPAGGMILISTTTLTGASVVLSSIPQTYKNLTFIVRNFRPADDNKHCRMRFNGNSGASTTKYFANAASEQLNQVFDEDGFYICRPTTNTATKSLIQVTIPDYTNTSTWKSYFGLSWVNNVSTTTNFDFLSTQGIYKEVDAITSLTLFPTSGNFTSGTVLLYGVS